MKYILSITLLILVPVTLLRGGIRLIIPWQSSLFIKRMALTE